jgi:hypothetical protein
MKNAIPAPVLLVTGFCLLAFALIAAAAPVVALFHDDFMSAYKAALVRGCLFLSFGCLFYTGYAIFVFFSPGKKE